MKKLLCVTLSVLLLFTLFACGESSGEPTSGGESDAIVVGYAQVGAESAWRKANTASFQAAFGDDPNYDYRFVDCNQKPELQVVAVSDFIAQEVDYIVIAPIEEGGWDEILGEAKDAGIPVILSDRMIKTEDDSLYVAWVGGNFSQEGVTCMQWLNGYLKEIGRDNETVNIFHMQGSMDSSAQIGRTQGIEAGVDANSNYVLKEQQTGEFTMAKGEEVMDEWLQKYNASEIDVLIAENDDMAFGAIKAMEKVGIVPGVDVIIVSFDSAIDAINAVIDGRINCTVECNPLHGPRVKEIIETLEAGGTPEKKQYVEEGYFDIKNAAMEKPGRQY